MGACFLLFVFSKITIDRSIPDYIGGLCIGATYYVITVATHQITGAGNNPALTLPLNFVSGDFENIIVYVTAPVLGALLGVFLFVVISSEASINKKERRRTVEDEIEGMEHEEGIVRDENEEMIREDKEEKIKEN